MVIMTSDIIMVKNNSDSDVGNLLPTLRGLRFSISSKGSWYPYNCPSDKQCVLYEVKTRKEGNVLFNDTLNTFYLRLYGVRHMADSERGNLLPPHMLLFPISSKGSFICNIPETG